MDPTLLNRPQERDAGRQQTTDQDRRRDLLIECDVLSTGICIATFSGLLTFGALYLYYYISEIPTNSLWYSLIFIFLFLASIVWTFYTKYQIKEFHAMQRRELELKHVEQPVDRQIQQHAKELNCNNVQDSSSSYNFYNETRSTSSNRTLSNRSSLNSVELITDMQQDETSDNEAGSPEYPTVNDHGDFVEYVFGPLPVKRPILLKANSEVV